MIKKEDIVGAWDLISFELSTADNDITYPLGISAKGSLYYLPSGQVSVHIMDPNRLEYVSPEQFKEGKLKYADLGYLAYSGHYHLDPSQALITHSVDISVYPEWISTKQIRVIRLSGDLLSLSSPGTVGPDKVQFHLHWKRH